MSKIFISKVSMYSYRQKTMPIISTGKLWLTSQNDTKNGPKKQKEINEKEQNSTFYPIWQNVLMPMTEEENLIELFVGKSL